MSRTFRNISAVASKELRSYFVSPVAWVMLGLFAFIFGWFFTVYLNVFNQQSLQGGGGQPINVNMMLIRPLLSNASVLVLFLLPMITMRTYSEEKRSGTIELLADVAAHRPRDHRSASSSARSGCMRRCWP